MYCNIFRASYTVEAAASLGMWRYEGTGTGGCWRAVGKAERDCIPSTFNCAMYGALLDAIHGIYVYGNLEWVLYGELVV